MAKKQIKTLVYALVVFLFFTYILALFNSHVSYKNKKAVIKQSFLTNNSLNTSFSSIDIFDCEKNERISLFYNSDYDYWFIKYFNDFTGENFIPCNNDRVMKFLNSLSQKHNFYKVSKKNNVNDFLSNENKVFELSLFYSDGRAEKLIFGKHTFSQLSRYFTFQTSEYIYECETVLDNYLSTSISFWSEAELISSFAGSVKEDQIMNVSIFDYINNKSLLLSPSDEAFHTYISKVLQLRHGNVRLEQEKLEPLDELKLADLYFYLGNKSTLVFNIYKSDSESEYLLKINWNIYNSQEETFNDFIYFEKITLWTFKQLLMDY